MLTKLNEICFADEITLWWNPSDEIIALRWLNFLLEKIWLDWVDSNHRPHAYQACALTTWATIHYRGRPRTRDSPSFVFVVRSLPDNLVRFNLFMAPDPRPVVEMMGFEPMTPCLQGRCSPNWATPPYLSEEWRVKSEEFLVEIWTCSNFFLFFSLLSLIFSLSLGFFPSSLFFERSFKIEQWIQRLPSLIRWHLTSCFC